MRRYAFALGALLVPQVLLIPQAAEAAARLSVEDVVRIALSTHPSLASTRANAQGADDMAESARGRLLPSVLVADEFQYYDSAFAIGLAGGPPIVAREQKTNAFTVSANQPVVGLLRRSQEYSAQTSNAAAARAGVQVAEAKTKEALQIEYLRMFQAQAMEEIAKTADGELGEQVTVTAARLAAGTATNADLLRVKVAQANARQQGIGARTQATVARATLLSAIGLAPTDHTVEFLEPTSLLQVRGGDVGAKESTEDEEGRALAARPEVRRAELAAQAAGHEERARFYALFPEVDVGGAYQRVDGQVFAPKDSAFVGVRASWPVWEWGASAKVHSAAEARASAAQSDLESERRQVRVEVTARTAELDATVSAVLVAEQAIASAQEAYRVTEVEVRAGSATVTDLLDAQSALTQARLNLTRARYEQAIARVELARALGTN